MINPSTKDKFLQLLNDDGNEDMKYKEILCEQRAVINSKELKVKVWKLHDSPELLLKSIQLDETLLTNKEHIKRILKLAQEDKAELMNIKIMKQMNGILIQMILKKSEKQSKLKESIKFLSKFTLGFHDILTIALDVCKEVQDVRAIKKDIVEFFKETDGFTDLDLTKDYFNTEEDDIKLRDNITKNVLSSKATSFKGSLNKTQTYNALGIFYMKMNENKMALKCFLKAERQSSNSILLYKNIATIYTFFNDYKQAAKYYIKAANIIKQLHSNTHPLLPFFYNNIGLSYYNAKNYIKAEAYFLKALPLVKKKLLGTLYVNIGSIYSKLEKQKIAIEWYMKALKSDTADTVLVYNKLGFAYNELHDNQKAFKYWSKGISLSKDLSYSNQLATVCNRLGKYEQAIKWANKALRIPNSKAAVYNNLAYAYNHIENYYKAIAYSHKAIKVIKEECKDKAIAYNNLAMAYNGLKDFEQGKEYSLKAISILKDENHDSANNMAVYYNNKEEYKSAIKECDRALRIGLEYNDLSSLAMTYRNLGFAYFKLQQHKDVIKNYTEAISIMRRMKRNEVGLIEIYSMLRISYGAVYDWKNVENCSLKLVEMKVEEPIKVYNNLGLTYHTMGKYKKEVNCIKKSLRLSKKIYNEGNENIYILYLNLALAYHSRCEYCAAIKCYKRAIREIKKIKGHEHRYLIIPYQNLACLYYETENYENALIYYKKAKNLIRAYYGLDSVYMFNSYNCLGATCYYLGYYKAALKYFTNYAKIDKKLDNVDYFILTPLVYLGKTYYKLSDYQFSSGCFIIAIREMKKLYGENSLSLIEPYNNLGTIFINLGGLPTALENLKEALRILKKFYRKNDQIFADTYTNIGMVFHRASDYKEAIKYYCNALYLSKDDLLKAASLCELIGLLYKDKGDSQRAIEYYNKGVRMIINNFGVNDLRLVEYYVRLSLIYDETMNHENSIGYFMKIINIYIAKYGKNCLSLSKLYVNIGARLYKLKYYKEAYEQYVKAIKVAKLKYSGIEKAFVEGNVKEFGKLHSDIKIMIEDVLSKSKDKISNSDKLEIPNISDSPSIPKHHNQYTTNNSNDVMEDTVEYVFSTGEKARMERELLRKIKMIKQSGDKNSIFLADAYNNIGILYTDNDDSERGVECFKLAYEVAMKNGDRGFAVSRHICSNLLAAYTKIIGASCISGNIVKAVHYLELKIEVHKDLDGEYSEGLIVTYRALYEIYKGKGNREKELTILQALIDNIKKIYGEYDGRLMELYSSLIILHQHFGNQIESAKIFTHLISLLKIHDGIENQSVLHTYFQAAANAEDIGNITDAIKYYEEMLEPAINVLGENSQEVLSIYKKLSNLHKRNAEHDRAEAYEFRAMNLLEGLD